MVYDGFMATGETPSWVRILIGVVVVLLVSLLSLKVYFLTREIDVYKATANVASKTITDISDAENSWKPVEPPDVLFQAPSLLSIRENESPQPLLCLNLSSEQAPYDRIRDSVAPYPELASGLKEIENYTYTMHVVDESGEELPSQQSRQNISYTAVCQIGERAYAVLFLTTGANGDKPLLSMPKVQAAGGWLGDSNLAIIEEGKTTIYEKFTANADHIKLRSVGGDPELLRFGAYYNCNSIPLLSDKTVVLSCHDNMYAFDRAEHTFRELGICGAVVKDHSYMTSTMACYDESGSRFYFRDDDVLPQ